MSRNILILGASRGLGAGFARDLPSPGDTVWMVSRGEPAMLRQDDGVKRIWVQADLASHEAATTLEQTFSDQALDAVIYNAGIWEEAAFESRYDFEQVDPLENERIIAVNLTGAIHCIQKLIPALRRSANAKIVLIGSTSGMENNGTREVAYVASKFGLRGAGHALRENLRPDHIAVTCLNLGDLDLSAVSGAQSSSPRPLIPLRDIIALVKCLLDLSPASCVKEIDMPSMSDRTA